MKKNFWAFLFFLLVTTSAFAQQGIEQDINRRIKPPLEPQDISQQMNLLEKQLIEANREVDFWRNARFYNDRKKELVRQEKLVYWAQRTVEINNEMTRLKQDRSYYRHKRYGKQRYYYKRD